MMSPKSRPFVRVVLLDFNGGQTIIEAVRAVVQTQWPADRIEIVCVDNGSTDGSLEAIQNEFPSVAVIRNGKNLGFPGNNSAMKELHGVDFVALVNSDAFVERNWLEPLVERAGTDRGIGAVSPKILFADRFLEITVKLQDDERRGPKPAALRGVSSNGQDVFTRCHVAGSGGRACDREGIFEWLNDGSIIRVPESIGGGTAGVTDVVVDIESHSNCMVTFGGSAEGEHNLSSGACVSLPLSVGRNPVDVVNNVGSWIDGTWTGHESGLYDVDRGQFDTPTEVGTWCGAAVLLRAEMIADVGLFDETFFLYYEDTDLAVRGRGRGWRFVTEPKSVVRHVHSASTVEGSAVAEHYIERNRLLVVLRHASVSDILRIFARHVLVTGSYLRTAYVAALSLRQRPDLTQVHRRTASFLAALKLLPRSLVSRRKIASHRLLSRHELVRQIGSRPDGSAA
ncbi:MAG: glycosyltransferase [Actinobacteria bacterium]|uniref:Unannotated protein n=1 Tax=freshwater metagenome TaxID=449393 RepID=A0A6J6AQK6_9ZZZZ|nr:glycosyltransferase [Actinomycetota bacterium]MSY34260.1 glycosyltransferase [Actinomycetota bacterium]MTA42443.1 glycosyltransferase [Actinomycetota bacterium]MTA44840.1 glycosyltransferase [Actinomycetota bacterium]MTB23637.1 glycosyltransferase [Actinomycetota bacterium]